MKEKGFIFSTILISLFFLAIVYGFVYLNLDYRLAIALLFIVAAIDTILTKKKIKEESKTPLAVRIGYVIFGLIPSFASVGNIFIYYLIFLILLVVIEYYFNIARRKSSSYRV